MTSNNLKIQIDTQTDTDISPHWKLPSEFKKAHFSEFLLSLSTRKKRK